MPYDYRDIKEAIFTDEGQRMFLEIRDRVKRLLAESGAFKLSHVIKGTTGDSWMMIACVDRLREIGEIIELTNITIPVQAQDRVFIYPR